MINTSCFGTNYIGIRGCGETTPDSGIYINDLPGMSLRRFADLANEEVVQGIELVRRYEQEAIRITSRDFLTLMGNKVRINSPVDIYTRGYIGDTFSDPSARYVGFEIEKTDDDRFTRIQVDYINFMANANGVSTVYIEDGNGSTPEEFAISATGINTQTKTYTDFKATNDLIRVYIDTKETDGVAFDFQLADEGIGSSRGSDPCLDTHCRCRDSGCTCFSVRGITSDDQSTWAYGTQEGCNNWPVLRGY